MKEIRYRYVRRDVRLRRERARRSIQIWLYAGVALLAALACMVFVELVMQ